MARARLFLPLMLVAACNSPSIYENAPYDGPPSAPEPNDYGRWLTMDVAPDGQRIVLAAYDEGSEGLIFSVGVPQEDGTVAWKFEQVDGYASSAGGDPGDRGQYASMAVAPDGTVWIAYYDADAENLRWAHRSAGGPATNTTFSWTTGVIDESEGVGTWASLDIDTAGNPVVAYHDEANGVLKVAHLQSTDGATATWSNEVVATGTPFAGTETLPPRAADVGEFARIDASTGTEFIAYYDRGQQRLGLVEGTAGTYTQQHVTDEGADQGQWPSILIDVGEVSIAYHDVTGQSLMIATRSQGSWVHEVADNAPFVGADNEIVKRGGRVGVLYFDGYDNNLKYASKNGASWVTATVAGEDGVPLGYHNEIVRVGDTWFAGTYSFATNKVHVQEMPVGNPGEGQ